MKNESDEGILRFYNLLWLIGRFGANTIATALRQAEALGAAANERRNSWRPTSSQDNEIATDAED